MTIGLQMSRDDWIPEYRGRAWLAALTLAATAMLAGCVGQPPQPAGETAVFPVPAGTVLTQPRSRWVATTWSELPGFEADHLHDAWNAWLRSCERPVAPFERLCNSVRQLTLATTEEQRAWLQQHLQPYRVETASGDDTGLLTSYFEPFYEASRIHRPGFEVPLYAPPAGLPPGSPWYSRREIDTNPTAQARLAGREIAWLADPVDALILQIQGSGRVLMTEADGRRHVVRLAFSATNNQPYRSPGAWLKSQAPMRDVTWPGIKTWLAAHPERVQEFLWSNPRVVFFQEQPLADADLDLGPRGAHGVPLTAGRSIAVDPGSIPYGTPVWLASPGPVAKLQRLVIAQDTGSAITGSVRADYFAGSGADAGELAGRLSQPLRLWALWPMR